MPFYQSNGLLPQKRYTNLRKADGGIHYEHLMSAGGFEEEASLLYHLRSPSRVTSVERMAPFEIKRCADPVIRNLLFRIDRVRSEGDYLTSRKPMLTSDALTYYIAKPSQTMESFYRNTLADELIVVVQGSGTLQSAFGDIKYKELDLILVPRGDTVRLVLDSGPQLMVIVESGSPITIPTAFLKPNGQFHEHAPYHERDLRPPRFRDPIDKDGEFSIIVKTGAQLVRNVLDHHPFDVVGWDGCFYPFALSLRDYEPATSRIFLLPDQYKVLTSERTMMTCIVPRRLPDHPDPSPAQAFHQNMDFDEVLYRFSGSTGLTEPQSGTFTLHPRGLDHGPKPGFETTPKRDFQDAWGFMLDTREMLSPTVEAMSACDDSYAETWVKDQGTATKKAR